MLKKTHFFKDFSIFFKSLTFQLYILEWAWTLPGCVRFRRSERCSSLYWSSSKARVLRDTAAWAVCLRGAWQWWPALVAHVKRDGVCEAENKRGDLHERGSALASSSHAQVCSVFVQKRWSHSVSPGIFYISWLKFGYLSKNFGK